MADVQDKQRSGVHVQHRTAEAAATAPVADHVPESTAHMTPHGISTLTHSPDWTLDEPGYTSAVVPAPVEARDLSDDRIAPGNLRTRLVLADAVAVLVGTVVAFAIWLWFRPVQDSNIASHLLIMTATYPIWIVAMASQKLYVSRVVDRVGEELRRLWTACAIGTLTAVGLGFAIKYGPMSRLWVVAVFLSVGVCLSIERQIARSVFRRLRRTGRISRRIAVIGTDHHARDLARSLRHDPSLGYAVTGFIGDESIDHRGGGPWLGDCDDALALLDEHNCSGVVISLRSVSVTMVNRLTRCLTDSGYHVALSSSLTDINMTRIRPQTVDGRTLLYIEATIRDGWRARAKRAFDVAFAMIALVLAAPVIAVAAIAVKLGSRGPVFFRQKRVGVNGKKFEMIKLRTMVADAEARREALLERNESDGPLFKMQHDPRVTRVGRFLRAWSIDELPQFWNVLAGEMSVVGPRPALPSEVDEWDDDLQDRLRVLPGITGLWQVTGRSDTSFDQYKRLDLFYVDNWSLAHDLLIVGKTFSAVLLKRGAK